MAGTIRPFPGADKIALKYRGNKGVGLVRCTLIPSYSVRIPDCLAASDLPFMAKVHSSSSDIRNPGGVFFYFYYNCKRRYRNIGARAIVLWVGNLPCT